MSLTKNHLQVKLSFIMLSLVLLLFLSACGDGDSIEANIDLDRLYLVKKKDFAIKVFMVGIFEAQKNHTISWQGKENGTIRWLIDEGERVKKDELICLLDTQALEDRYNTNLEALRATQELLLDAKQALEIQRKENALILSKAEHRIKKDEVSLLQFKRVDAKKLKDDNARKIKLAEIKLSTMRNKYRDLKNKISSGEVQQTVTNGQSQLDIVSADYEKAKSEYSVALIGGKIFVSFDYPSQVKNRVDNLEMSRLDIEKVKIQSVARLRQKEARIKGIQNRIKVLKMMMKEELKDLKAMSIRAPIDGIVVYGDPKRRNKQRKNRPQVGTRVRKRPFLYIPDFSEFKIAIEIPEKMRGSLRVGDLCEITVPAVPGKILKGSVNYVDQLPTRKLPWLGDNSPKIYKGIIKINGKTDKRVVTGLSANVLITRELIKESFAIPLEAVFDEEGKSYVFLYRDKKFERIEFKLGKRNSDFVETLPIKSDDNNSISIKEGDSVALYNPYKKKTN